MTAHALRRRRGAGGRRGWVLIAVLVVLAVLSALVAGFFLTAQDASSLNQVAAGRMVASVNADLGLQEAIRALRARQLDLSVVGGVCTDADVAAGTCPSMFSSALVDNGAGSELVRGGGLQYQYFVYRRVAPGDIGVPPNRYVVRAVGYYGYTLTSSNLVTSIVESEIDIGDGTGGGCVGGYECQ